MGPDEDPVDANPLTVANHARHPIFTDRGTWVAIRGYLLMIVKAIDTHAKEGLQTMATRAALLGIAGAIELR